jgi:serine/threonine protein kinase
MTKSFSPETDAVQGVLSDVTLHQEIARGGQKLVFSAESSKYGRLAVKLIRPGTKAAEKRASREIEVACRLEDPHFPRLFESKRIVIDGLEVICIYEEFLEGMSLRESLQQHRRFPEQEVAQIGCEILTALQILHDRSIVHRDVKPENVYLGSDGRCVLLDLGIARQLGEASLTDDQAFFGPLTPGYGAPEQIRNEKRSISSRTDLFALGVLLHECFAGNNPFVPDGATPAAALQNTLTLTPPRLDSLGSSARLANVVSKCTEKAAHRRFASPASALRELRPLCEVKS